MKTEITIRKGFDGHFHPRDGDVMRIVLPYTARQFSGGVAMGNLAGSSVIDTIEKHSDYAEQIFNISPTFEAIIPLMVTQDLLSNDNIIDLALNGGIHVFKFIPGGLTTNGAVGLTLYSLYSRNFHRLLRGMEVNGLIFSCHFEVGTSRIKNDSTIDPRNQEREAIRFLQFLLENYPKLKIVVEHASSKEMIKFIEDLPGQYKIGATLTPQHASITYPQVLDRKGKFVDSRLYCKPVAKYADDVTAVRLAMCSGNPKFFAGTDSAPHFMDAKTRAENPAAGIFSAPSALQKYVEIFDGWDRLDYLEKFYSISGPVFYGINPSSETITVVKRSEKIPEIIFNIPVFLGGSESSWSIAN